MIHQRNSLIVKRIPPHKYHERMVRKKIKVSKIFTKQLLVNDCGRSLSLLKNVSMKVKRTQLLCGN